MFLTLISIFPVGFFVAYNVLIGLYHTIFTSNYQIEEWYSFSSVLLYLILIYAIADIVKRMFVYMDKDVRVPEARRVTRNLLAGLGGITLCGIVPRILAMSGADSYMLNCYYHVFNTSFIILFFKFCPDFDKIQEANYTRHWDFIKLIVAIHLLGLIFAIRHAISTVGCPGIFTFQCYFTLFFIGSSVDFYVIWMDGVGFKSK